jgi:hypothetical protein
MRLMNAKNEQALRARNGLVGVVAAVAAIALMVIGVAHAASHNEDARDSLAECAVCTIVQSADQQTPPAEAFVAAPVAAFAERLAAAATPAPAAGPVLLRRSRAPPAISPRS